MLDVVPDLVRDDVRLREVARGAELRLHHLIEPRVDVQALVGRAVEGAHLRGGVAAPARGDGGAEDHEGGGRVGHGAPPRHAARGELHRPDVFRGGQHHAREVARRRVGGVRGAGASATTRGGLGAAAEEGAADAVRHQEVADAEDHRDDDGALHSRGRGRGRGVPAPAHRPRHHLCRPVPRSSTLLERRWPSVRMAQPSTRGRDPKSLRHGICHTGSHGTRTHVVVHPHRGPDTGL
jgi:hypothetical protein